MFNFQNFEEVDLNTDGATMSLTLNSIIFSKSVVATLGFPNYIKMYINKNDMLVAVTPCNEFDEKKIEFCSRTSSSSVRINNRELVRKIKNLFIGLEFERYRIVGKYYSDDKVFVFDLHERVRIGRDEQIN